MTKLERWAGLRGARAQGAARSVELCAQMKLGAMAKAGAALAHHWNSWSPVKHRHRARGAPGWPSPQEARTGSHGTQARGLTSV